MPPLLVSAPSNFSERVQSQRYTHVYVSILVLFVVGIYITNLTNEYSPGIVFTTVVVQSETLGGTKSHEVTVSTLNQG